MPLTLTDRQQYVLWATVKHYIATAEPVGSKALVNEYNLNISPATIRNAMGCLEKAGLLYQPHTSAGRVPSDSGYRIYVDELITPSETIARQVDVRLKQQLNAQKWSLEALMRGAARMLAQVSGYIAMITMPQTSTARLLHLQLVHMGGGKIMVAIVTDSYHSESMLMELSPALEEPEAEIVEQELQVVSNFLNSKLRGKYLTELYQLDGVPLGRDFERYAESLKAWLASFSRRDTTKGTEIAISGVSEVLRQPEFSELNQVQTLLQLLEDQLPELWPLIFEDTQTTGKRVKVRIGAENPMDALASCALISATYNRHQTPVGSVSVLGPTRMVYENAIAAVAAAADYLSEALS
ncbi:MAG: heat-inducible transcriptional repressor HrcA [Oscillatoriaceae cyanobacterium]